MKKNESKIISIIENTKSPLNLIKEKLIYKNYIYNLFSYNQNKRKKIKDKNNSNQKFQALINSITTPKKNKSKKKILLNLNSYENNKTSNISPKIIKSIKTSNLNILKSRNHSNINITNIIPNILNKTNIKTRNNNTTFKYLDLFNTYNFTLNKMYTHIYTYTGKNNIQNNLKNKSILIKPITNSQSRTEIFKNNNENRYINLQKNNSKKKLKSAYYNSRINDVKNKKNEENYEKPNSMNKKNKLKVLFCRDVNDMKPRNRFHLLKRELLVEDNKINKMFMKFKKQITKKEIILKWLKSNKKLKNLEI